MEQTDSETEKSERRTQWAEDRTLLASERTYSSWMGTGLASIGVALGMKAVFGDFSPTWAAKLVASVFLVAAVLLFWAARTQAYKTRERLSDTDTETQSTRNFTLLASLMTLGAVGTGIVLWSI